MKHLDHLISIACLSMAAAAAALGTTNAAAQSYPARQILMVVPLQAGTAAHGNGNARCGGRHEDDARAVQGGHTGPHRFGGRASASARASFEFATWFAVVAPAATPRAIVDRLNTEILKAAALPEVREQLQSAGYVIYGSTPEQLTASITDGIAKVGKIIREANIKVE